MTGFADSSGNRIKIRGGRKTVEGAASLCNAAQKKKERKSRTSESEWEYLFRIQTQPFLFVIETIITERGRVPMRIVRNSIPTS